MTIMNLTVKNIIGDQNLFAKIVKLDSIFTKNVKKVEAFLGTEKIKKPGRKSLNFC